MTSEPLALHPDRFFSPIPAVREIARELYAAVADLPLVCPHGHVPPALLADDESFPEPTALLITPDHYIFRMLRSQGVRMEDMGIPTRDGAAVEADPRVVWQRFADHYHLFLGTPTRAWLDQTFAEVFGVDQKLTSGSAAEIYDHLSGQLRRPEFRPRALFDRFSIDVLTTTDGAADSLDEHRRIRESGWGGRVIPCFRPDAVFRIASPEWRGELDRLADATGTEIGSYATLIRVLEERRTFFRSMGATSTDHAVVVPYTHRLPDVEANHLLQRALAGTATEEDQGAFEAHMLMEMARMSTEDGLVMQLHPGALRDHNAEVFERFGRDMGGDIPVATEYTHNLRELLNAYGSDPRLTLVVFTLDETAYARELAPLAGHYPAMRLGPAWWFHDSIEGMRRYRTQTTETAGIYNTVGFNDDTRAFLSIPARHDLSRRVDADFLAGLVAEHRVDEADAHRMIHALAVGLVRDTYNLGDDASVVSEDGVAVNGRAGE